MRNSHRDRRAAFASNRARLRALMLEDRTVPSTLVWVGDVNGSWGASVGGNTNWRNATTGTDNARPQNGDDLTFPTGAGNRTNTNDFSNLSVNSIFLGGTDYAIGGNAITLTSLSDTSLLGANALNLPITLTGTLTASVNVTSTQLTLGGVISGSGGLVKNGAGILRLSGASANTYTGLTTVNLGTLELAKTGATLAVPGDLTINGGAAREILGAQIVNTSFIDVFTGGTFDLNGQVNSIGLLSVDGGSVTIGTGTLTAGPVAMTAGNITSTGAGKLVLAGNVLSNAAASTATISGNLDLGGPAHNFAVAEGAADPDLDISAVISNGGLNKIGGGDLRLDGSASNTYAGLTTVSAGTLELAKTGATLAVPGNLTINSGGTAREIFGAQIANTSTVAVNAGGTFDLNGHDNTIGALTVVGGSVTIGAGLLFADLVTMTGGSIASTSAGQLRLQGDLTTNPASAQATISGNLSFNGVTRTFAVADGSADPDLDISAVISNGGLTKAGAGTLRLSGSAANSYTGTTTVNTGTLELGKTGVSINGPLLIGDGAGTDIVRLLANNQIADSAPVTLQGGGTLVLNDFSDAVGVLTVGAPQNGGSVDIGAGTLTTSGTVTMTSGNISSIGAGKLVLGGNVTINIPATTGASISGNLDLNGVTRTFTVADGPASADLFIGAAITNGGLQKEGPGALQLGGQTSNAYTQTTFVNNGVLFLAALSGAITIPANLTINTAVVQYVLNDQIADTATVTVNSGGTFDLSGKTDTVGTMTIAGALLKTSGTTAGQLTAGNTSLNSAATLAMRLVDVNTSDRLMVNGTVTIGGTLSLNPTQALAIGTAITLIDNDSTDPVTGTFTNLPQGATLLVGGQLFAISYTGGTGNDVVVTRTGGPTVLSTQVNDGSAQRSRVTSLSVTFSAQVAFSGPVASAFTLTRTGGGAVTFQASASVVNGVTVVTLNGFTGSETEFGSLRDGRYTLTALATQITFGGLQLDGNGDGTAGDNYAFGDAQGLFRFYGDINGDRHVDIADFGIFSQSLFNAANYIAALDFNNDGHIDIVDFGQFAVRFFTPLP